MLTYALPEICAYSLHILPYAGVAGAGGRRVGDGAVDRVDIGCVEEKKCLHVT